MTFSQNLGGRHQIGAFSESHLVTGQPILFEVVSINLTQAKRKVVALLLQHFCGRDCLIQSSWFTDQASADDTDGIWITRRFDAHDVLHHLAGDGKSRTAHQFHTRQHVEVS
ncbi:hypothetical protein ASF73_10265 [Xanthomonas sp. Leaf131]|nr:hypothetical protein ASF73_10265 [Xanthomonas sp. Leaf131]